MISEFAAAEVASALSRLVRMGELTAEDATEALADFDAWRASETTVNVDGADIRFAGAIVRGFELGLRAPDALHLAICRRLAAVLVTLDTHLAAAAEALSIGVVQPGCEPTPS